MLWGCLTVAASALLGLSELLPRVQELPRLQAAEVANFKLVGVDPVEMNDGNMAIDLKFDKRRIQRTP